MRLILFVSMRLKHWWISLVKWLILQLWIKLQDDFLLTGWNDVWCCQMNLPTSLVRLFHAIKSQYYIHVVASDSLTCWAKNWLSMKYMSVTLLLRRLCQLGQGLRIGYNVPNLCSVFFWLVRKNHIKLRCQDIAHNLWIKGDKISQFQGSQDFPDWPGKKRYIARKPGIIFHYPEFFKNKTNYGHFYYFPLIFCVKRVRISVKYNNRV